VAGYLFSWSWKRVSLEEAGGLAVANTRGVRDEAANFIDEKKTPLERASGMPERVVIDVLQVTFDSRKLEN